MNKMHRGRDLPFWLLVGWILAAVSCNALFAEGIMSYEALYEWIRQGWQKSAQKDVWTVSRVILLHVTETAAELFVCRSQVRQIGIRVILFLYGWSLSACLVLMTWNSSLKGIWMFFLSGFPQEIFELLLIGSLCYRYGCHHTVRSRRFAAVISLLLCLRIAGELWINSLFIGKI